MNLGEAYLLIAGVFAGSFLAVCYYEIFVIPPIRGEGTKFFFDPRSGNNRRNK